MSLHEWEERRRYKRYPSDLLVHVKDLDRDETEPREGGVANVSRGGVFIRTKNPFPAGMDLQLRIDVVTPFGEAQEIFAEAKVVWVSQSPGEEGMGLTFTKIDRHSQYALLACAYRGVG